MCGRFVVTADPVLLAERSAAINEVPASDSDAIPDYNVAPTATIAAVVCRHAEPGDAPTRRVRAMRWGLVPPWSADGGPVLINARAETVVTSPTFRASAHARRCLIPMAGFYEWRAEAKAPGGKTARKTPFFLHRDDGGPLFAAGLWALRQPGYAGGGDQSPRLSCTIITTEAVGRTAEIHHRMPLVMADDDFDAWLDPDVPADPELLARPTDIDNIASREVSTLVNDVRNNGPGLIEPAGPPAQYTLY